MSARCPTAEESSRTPTAHRQRRLKLSGALLALAMLVPCAVEAADAVNVNFVEPARFVDAGGYGADRDRTLAQIDNELKSLGRQYLPPGETLKIDVLDVELAGHTRPSFRAGRDIRVLRGGADWPRVDLSYTLQAADGRVLEQRQESVSDMNYLSDTAAGFGSTDSLHYEKAMLKRWFKSRFSSQQAAQR